MFLTGKNENEEKMNKKDKKIGKLKVKFLLKVGFGSKPAIRVLISGNPQCSGPVTVIDTDTVLTMS